MRKNSIKNTRINGEVQKVLSEIIRGEIKDPRISPLTSVVSVSVAPDLKTCKAFISVLGDEEAQAEYHGRIKECSRLCAPSAGKRTEPPEYAGDHVRAGSVHRVWSEYV